MPKTRDLITIRLDAWAIVLVALLLAVMTWTLVRPGGLSGDHPVLSEEEIDTFRQKVL